MSLFVVNLPQVNVSRVNTALVTRRIVLTGAVVGHMGAIPEVTS